MKYRKILHLDLDAFYCAVEELRDPALRGQAFAVGGNPGERGVVASCSYPARQYGIHSAMPMAQAVRRCPELIVVAPNFKAYGEVSRKVMAELYELTPMVERLSIDEAFLDVTMLPQSAVVIAGELQATINHALRLPCSLGVASNKLVAKIANNIGKAAVKTGDYPNSIKVVAPGDEAAFLADLPVRELWGVGEKTAERMAQLGIRTIGELARWDEAQLIQHFGKNGASMARHASGMDDRPVTPEHEAKSISKEITFSRDENDFEILKQVLRALSDGVGAQLRNAGLYGATIRIKLRWSDFTTLTRQITLACPTDRDDDIYEAAEALLRQNWMGRKARLIGVGVSGFEEPRRQLSLWDNPDALQRSRNLQNAIDALRDRYGHQAIQRGSAMKKKRDARE